MSPEKRPRWSGSKGIRALSPRSSPQASPSPRTPVSPWLAAARCASQGCACRTKATTLARRCWTGRTTSTASSSGWPVSVSRSCGSPPSSLPGPRTRLALEDKRCETGRGGLVARDLRAGRCCSLTPSLASVCPNAPARIGGVRCGGWHASCQVLAVSPPSSLVTINWFLSRSFRPCGCSGAAVCCRKTWAFADLAEGGCCSPPCSPSAAICV